MAETENENEVVEQTGGGKKKLFMIVGLAAVLLLGGGGGAAGFYFLSSGGSKADGGKTAKSKKSESKKGAEVTDAGGDAGKSLRGALQDDENVKTVIELAPFIVNLADVEEARYLRMTVSLGIGGEDGVAEAEPDEIFLARVKNAMLAILSTKKSEDVLTVEGKAKLRNELLKAAQTASGDGHIEAIYITDFIVQL
jgi:flagellar FliL protein